MDNKARVFSRELEINEKLAIFVASEDNVSFVRLMDDAIPAWRGDYGYIFLRSLADNKDELTKIAERIVRLNPVLPLVKCYVLSDRIIEIFAKENVGYVFVVRTDKLYIKTEIREFMSQAYIDKLIDEHIEIAQNLIDGEYSRALENKERYLFLKDKVVSKSSEVRAQIKGSFRCRFCGNEINILSATGNEDDKATCHKCGLIYRLEAGDLCVHIDEDALDYGFDMENEGEHNGQMESQVKKLKKRKVVEKWYRLTQDIFTAAEDFDAINKHLKAFVDSIERSEKMRREIIKGTITRKGEQ